MTCSPAFDVTGQEKQEMMTNIYDSLYFTQIDKKNQGPDFGLISIDKLIYPPLYCGLW